MQTIMIRDIAILAVETQSDFVHYLMNEQEVRMGVMVAINAEKVILAKENPEIASVIAQAEYKYADGISIVKAIAKKSSLKLERIAGADLWLAMMMQAAQFNVPVFILGAEQSVLAETVHKLQQLNVPVVGCHHGYYDNEAEIIAQIKQSGAKFVSVAMGSPRQECFMLKAKAIYPDCLYMGVGGTYDVFVGKVKRAPKIWQKIGLEWLYRLVKQPTRWQRQLRLVKFAYYYITKQL